MANSWKPLEIVIYRVQITTVFDGKGNQVRVRSQVISKKERILIRRMILVGCGYPTLGALKKTTDK